MDAEVLYGLNVFVKNAVVPDRKIALVKRTAGGPETIWFGWITEMPQDEFERADEAHVSEWTYNRIAEKAEATGKGIPLQ